MQDVYRNSFLNISAIAAEHSGEGLYSQRDPQHLWEEVVRVDVSGLHPSQAAEAVGQKNRANTLSPHDVDASTLETTGPAVDSKFTPLAKVQNCLLLDVSNWETLVNQAPVNQRGWVIQERLLAPRVLHFCRGRIAWECAEFDDIEGHVEGIPNYQIIGDDIHEGIIMKGLDPEIHGRSLRRNRLRGVVEPLDSAGNGIESRIVHSLELWSRIVEMYCKTHLTWQKDKLIALSGLAHRMAGLISGSEERKDHMQLRYIAGLWDVHLVSQLLWHVEPLYRGDSDSRSNTIEYSSRRPKEYRAPSFSWASVDAQSGNGISCGHVLDSDAVLVELPQGAGGCESDSEEKPWEKGVSVLPETGNHFGLVRNGHIRLRARVHHVKLQREGTHYYWFLLVDDDMGTEPGKGNENEKKNFNVYLDCPSDDDKEDRLTESDEIYCIPMAYGSPSRSTDIVCLLLEKTKLLEKENPMEKAANVHQTLGWPVEYREWTFRRIGYTRLSATFDRLTWDYIIKFRPEQKDLGGFYDETTGTHIVCII
ncbi:heterokaryon incompatibility protein [Diaporthe helianthi]|uniref:Heterokaryon incompatibility protein n=1 Tax=Diaporthe helianthi TaxID=158607 RepID=A0A2P5HLT1_DIAHE|nr:heterokaryon incompatibility protein [Diaporthe helianthi]